MRLRTIDLRSAAPDELAAVLRRSAVPDPSIRGRAAEIVHAVRTGGDGALHAAATQFGGSPAGGAIHVDRSRPAEAWRTSPTGLRSALEHAARNIRIAHEPQRPVDAELEVSPGVQVDRRWTPLNRVGVYVPGGMAPYPSSLLMGAIPAQVAGVTEVVVATPADASGRVSDAVLATAGMLGITEVYAMGGAQAVGALAYGTETIDRVDKIVGPGSVWVTAAKLAVYGDCAVDLPAGPSEALVMADDAADARLVAADLLCQAEHGPDSPVVLVTTSAALADAVGAQLDDLLPRLARRDILRKALGDHGLVVHTTDIAQAVAFANRYAPEHLSVHTRDARRVARGITAAGSVFVGTWSPESAGDYATGANHVLPTGGLAGSHGPLSVEDFGSWRQVQELTQDGLASLRSTIATLAEAEGLTAHRLAVDIRFEDRR